jgi:hypothetical protein
MDTEIDDLLKIALDSSLSSYYRKDAIYKLGRIKKSAALSSAIIKLMANMEDEALQKEVMDLVVKFALTGAVNLVVPIGLGKGRNARYALNILAKLGGVEAYKSLKSLADKPGFDLTSSAASRALHDLLCREPDLEKTDLTEFLGSGAPLEVTATSQSSLKEQPMTSVHPQVKVLEESLAQKQLELQSLRQQKDGLALELAQVKKPLVSTDNSTQLEQENHLLRTELSKLKAVYKEKFSIMSLEISDLKSNLSLAKKRVNKAALDPKSAAMKGCLGFIIAFVALIIFIIMIIR